MLNTDSDGFLPSGQVAETSNLLLLVESIGGHFHSSAEWKKLGSETIYGIN
jgi:hypothetical protein